MKRIILIVAALLAALSFTGATAAHADSGYPSMTVQDQFLGAKFAGFNRDYIPDGTGVAYKDEVMANDHQVDTLYVRSDEWQDQLFGEITHSFGQDEYILLGIYSDDNGAPDALLTSCSVPHPNGSNPLLYGTYRWNSCELPESFTAEEGETYWTVMVNPYMNTHDFYLDNQNGVSGATASVVASNNSLGALPDPFGSGSTYYSGPGEMFGD